MPEQISKRQQRLLEECEIKSLLTRERYYRDTAQWEFLRNSYHPDASKTKIKISWFEGDIEGFVNGSKAMASGGTQAVHIIIPVEIDINGNKALAQSTGNIQIRFQYDGNDYDCTSYTTFVSRLEKVDEEWKILTLDCIYDRDTLTAPIPVEKPVRLPVDQFVCRRSYKCIGWVLSLRGYNINQNLPGKDDPASVIHFMAENVAWLQS